MVIQEWLGWLYRQVIYRSDEGGVKPDNDLVQPVAITATAMV